MPKCLTPSCRTYINVGVQGAPRSYCRECAKYAPEKITRSQAERDVARIKEQLAQAESHLASLPVEVDPQELARLRLIEQEAKDLQHVLFTAGVPGRGYSEERTLPYLSRMFNGLNLRGMFRGRH